MTRSLRLTSSTLAAVSAILFLVGAAASSRVAMADPNLATGECGPKQSDGFCSRPSNCTGTTYCSSLNDCSCVGIG